MLAVANTGSCVGPQNKIGHPARRYTQLIQVPMLVFHGISLHTIDSGSRVGYPRNIDRLQKTCVIVFPGWHFHTVGIIFVQRDSIVWEPIRKRAHTQLVRKHSATVVSAR